VRQELSHANHDNQGKYPFPVKDDLVPGSDGAGVVESVGSRVTKFKPGGAYRLALLRNYLEGEETADKPTQTKLLRFSTRAILLALWILYR
jgi:hypothetical protein